MPTSIEAIIERQLSRWEIERRLAPRADAAAEPGPRPIITISRQHGTRGVALAEHLAARFQYTLLHRDIIDRLHQSTGHFKRLLEALDERSRSKISNWFEAMFAGQYVDESDYVRGLFQTISSVAELGGAVVVGRGANFIVGPARGFHVRVVAPREMRVRHVAARRGCTNAEAAREVDRLDRERARFIRRLFERSANDPLGYDLVVNEAAMPFAAMTSLVEAAAREKLERLRTAALASV